MRVALIAALVAACGGTPTPGGSLVHDFGHDELAGEPAIFRFVWTVLGPDRARWEQAYSRDGEAWTVNWVMDFTRTAEACATEGVTARE
jgi:hypothetical protein